MILFEYHLYRDVFMKIMNRDTDYAIRALRLIALQHENLISAKEIAHQLDAPVPFLRKILQVLQQKGILTSHKGKVGGFSLNKTPDTIYFLDLIEAFHGAIDRCECSAQEKTCPDMDACLLSDKLVKIKQFVIDELKAITLASLLPEVKSHG